jgi:hypothetical protein
LRSCETDPEVAYLHLITAGEILGNYSERNLDDLLDEQMKGTLQAVAAGMPKGEKIARSIRGRLRQIKRRFAMALTQLVWAGFFANFEASESFLALNEETFKQRIEAAYDLRNKFVHTGIYFGTWIAPGSRMKADT